ncbi:MAG: DEAD/DEAH box helicase [bacterium]|nr:DEAD/DEAH box helicase [bacterium]MDZ4296235.1 DEAD/DEAH box helicase [Patescibacteria group bacterium]
MKPLPTTYEAITAFTQAPIDARLKRNLAQTQLVTPTPIQARTIRPALQGRDIFGTAQTGTGKTLAFVLPILQRLMQAQGRGIEALILVPTRELALQALETMSSIGKDTGISAVPVVGGLSESRQLEAIRRGARVAIATPGRLNDYLKRGLVNIGSVRVVVLDEADRMLDMGFLPQVRTIMQRLPKERQTMCFSATLSSAVETLIRESLSDPVRVAIGSTATPAALVRLTAYKVTLEQKYPMLLRLLEQEPGTFLVFTRTKYGADKLFRKLTRSGHNAAVLHGNKTQSQRVRALEGFKAGAHRVLVATDIAARGIHVHGIAHVVNFDMPAAAEDFIHRVGRTGRVAQTGVATTFVTAQEAREIVAIERILGKTIERLTPPGDLPVEPVAPREYPPVRPSRRPLDRSVRTARRSRYR